MTDNRLDQRAAEDNEFVVRSQAGDADAYNALVLKYQRSVYNLALRMLSDAGQAEDVAQDAFLSAWRNINRFRGGNFSAWLLRIATNACYDQIRRRQRHPVGSLEAVVGNDETPLELPDRGELPEDRTVRAELARAIVTGLQHVHPDQRAVLILADIQGLSYEEVATVLEVPVGTVKSRLSRGRGQLRQYFQQRPELLPDAFRFSNGSTT